MRAPIQSAQADKDLKTTSGIVAVFINAGIFAAMAFAGVVEAKSEREDPIISVDVEPVELPKLGEEKPKELPRIVEAPEPPPPETDAASLSRQKKEEELEKKREEEKKQRELDEQKRRDQEKLDVERQKKAEEDEKKKRDKAMRDAMKKLERDERADEDNPAGFEDGSKHGNSTDPNSRRNKETYINLVISALQRQFVVPSVIPGDLLKKLNADVQFRFDEDGKLVGQPRLVRSSGNKLFDDAALATLRKFAPGTPARIPVPPAHTGDLRKSVLKNGLTLTMDGNK